ncbi:MAG: DUF4339 domain-containing protein [Verrucomicrobiota bacterium]|nr:DUF4339 domain-containing protein [Verrucomicrobiota bacterium]MEE2813801.1 DUF4339 domain-containing protein [Verrucomicrobiota bacterium]
MIYVLRDGDRFGPYTMEDANLFLSQGSLLPTDQAWYEGASDWVPITQVPGIVFAAPTLPSPGDLSVEQVPLRSSSKRKKMIISGVVGLLVLGVGLVFALGGGGGKSEAANGSEENSLPNRQASQEESPQPPSGIMTFSKVEPIFRKHRCFECHHYKESKKAKADLDFSAPVTLRGFISPNEPGNFAVTPLVLCLAPDAATKMPPGNGPRVSKSEISLIIQWIADGAKF